MSKKLLSLFTILSLVLVFSSCEGPRGADGESTGWKMINKEARQGNWFWDDVSKEYYQDFKIPEITDLINNEGKIFVDVWLGNKTFEPCPSTTYFYDAKNKVDIAETTTYDHSQGTIRIKVRALDSFDFTPDDYQPQTKNVRITLLW